MNGGLGRQPPYRSLQVAYRGPQRFGVVVADSSEQTAHEWREDVPVLLVESEASEPLDALVGERQVGRNDRGWFGA
jgi:hypothetical protein